MKISNQKKSVRTKPAKGDHVAASSRDKYVLRLFVAGATVRSHQAVLRIRELCETILKGRVKLEVIDIYQQPELARANQIVATPTLIIQLPVPVRRFIGNLTTIADLFIEMDVPATSRLIP